MSAEPKRHLSTLHCVLVCVLVYGIAVSARLEALTGVLALQDAVGPFWAALRLDGRAHAQPYGVSLLIPYILVVRLAGSLWEAMNFMALLHSLAAPIACWICIRRSASGWMGGLLIGSLIGLDAGLIDTFQSGAEGYLAPALIGLAMAVRGPWAWVAFAIAVGNHPLAVSALPLVLVGRNLERQAWWGLCGAVLLVGMQVLGWGAPGVDSAGLGVGLALDAYVKQGGLVAVILLCGPLMGLWFKQSRAWSLRALACFLLLFLMGYSLGYLRDHHIRFLSIPAAICWTQMPRKFWPLLLGALVFPHTETRPPESGLRGSTLGLVNHLGDVVTQMDGPMVIDRVWVSGDPGVEPSALMLDMHLRGWGPIGPGESMVVVVAGSDDERGRVGSVGSVLLRGQGYEVVHARTDDVRKWSTQFCGTRTRLGGAWDALSVLEPEATTQSVGLWWECP